jgi:hypothetical protein
MEHENMENPEVAEIAATFKEYQSKLNEVIRGMVEDGANPPILAFALGFQMAELAASFMSFHEYDADRACNAFDTMTADIRTGFVEMLELSLAQVEKAKA